MPLVTSCWPKDRALAIANHDGQQGAGFPSLSLDITELVWLVLAFACFATLVWLFFQAVL